MIDLAMVLTHVSGIMPTSGEIGRVVLGIILASLLALRGRRRGALSESGARAAFLVGFLSVASGIRFGAALLTFYYAGTRATRFGAAHKRRTEDGYTHEAGNRSAGQVLASSGPGVALSVIYCIVWRNPEVCDAQHPGRTATQLAVLLFFAACAGDTLASEIGSVAGSQRPLVLLQPWRRVPAGTNGAVSLIGTLASGLGGLIVGLGFAAGAHGEAALIPTLVVGVVGGVLGSAVDSILGSLFQASWYDAETGKVLKETPVKGSELHARSVHIMGHDMLSGEAVNTLAACLTCLPAWWLVSLYG